MDWTLEEVEAVVSDYLEMLQLEIVGTDYNKAERNRALQGLTGRSKGSIEFKHQNISAVLIELGMPYIEGYKPRFNYQNLLRCSVESRLSGSNALVASVEKAVMSEVQFIPVVDWDSMWTEAPKTDDLPSTRFREEGELKKPTTTKNYLEQEAQNRSLGLAGEKLILEFEHRRLWQVGERKLADSIEHVSVTQGDGLGFDILSYEPDGSEKLIEVKTTRYGAMTPFFATRTEVDVSKENSRNYYLHRLFDFNKRPRVFGLQGALPSTCRLEPFSYSAQPK